VCVGPNQQEKLANKQFEQESGLRLRDWNNKQVDFSNRTANYDKTTDENTLAFSRATGAEQRDFGLEVNKFQTMNRSLYQNLVSSLPVNEGDTARRFGTSDALKGMYMQGMTLANLRRRGIQSTETLYDLGRQHVEANSRALGNRGMLGMAMPKPIKPKHRDWWQQGLDTLSFGGDVYSTYKKWTKK